MAEEKQFENKVKSYLKSKGCWVLKTWGGGFLRSGIPDLLICCKGKFIGVELKAEKGKVSPLQKYEIMEIKKAGGLALSLRPSGFDEFKKLIEEIINNEV